MITYLCRLLCSFYLQVQKILKEISHNCNIYFETIRTPIDSFKFKYHDHDYNKCRLIDIDDEGINDVSNELSKNNYLIDVICVAVHYSNRYGSSDDYISFVTIIML